MSNELFDQANYIVEIRKIARKKRYRRSRLDPLRTEIINLYTHGYSYRDITNWLRFYPRIKVSHSTVARAIHRWQSSIHPAP